MGLKRLVSWIHRMWQKAQSNDYVVVLVISATLLMKLGHT